MKRFSKMERKLWFGQTMERNVVQMWAAVSLGWALRDIQKTAAKETKGMVHEKRMV